MNCQASESRRPLIGIAPDVVEPRPGSVRATCPLTYARAVAEAGGEPVILPPIVELIPHQLAAVSGVLLTGGDDPRMEQFGAPTHPKATPVHPDRQAYDLALLVALREHGNIPALGVCLGMQMMALAAGGTLDQHLPETLDSHERHWQNAVHGLSVDPAGSVHVPWLRSGAVTSHHRQAVSSPGALRVIARSEDGVIEAVCDPNRVFHVGVQWHPERTVDPHLGLGVIRALVDAAGTYRRS